MADVNNKQLRNLMINMYPNKIHTTNLKDINFNSQNIPHIPKNTSKIQISEDSLNPDFTSVKLLKNRGDEGLKKWGISLIFTIISVFIFSELFLSFLDDICMNKDVSIFDINGKPKLMLTVCISLFLIIFTRIMLVFL